MAAGARSEPGRTIRAVARWARRHLALWILTAGALVTALATLLAVLIALPGQSDSTVSILILVLLVLLALSIVFPVAGRVVDDRDRVAGQVQARQDRIDQLLVQGSSAHLPLLAHLSNDILGATPTRYSIEGNAPYVEQTEADAEIRAPAGNTGSAIPVRDRVGNHEGGQITDACRSAASNLRPRPDRDLAA